MASSVDVKINNFDEYLPSNSSREAPPPVLTWLTSSSVPYLAQQVAVSPPPYNKTKTPMVDVFFSVCDTADLEKKKIRVLPTGVEPMSFRL